MTDHPVTPTPQLRQLWAQQAQRISPYDPVEWMQYVSEKAAQWGADQELEACCDWMSECTVGCPNELRAIRRPKPPSLKEQALMALAHILNNSSTDLGAETIRRALEALPDD